MRTRIGSKPARPAEKARLIVLGFISLLAAGPGGSGAAAEVEPPKQLTAMPCSDLGFAADDFGPGVACAVLEVPEMHDAGSARTLRLAVVTAKATGPAPGLPILYLHGGPGIATLDVVPRALKGKSWPLLRETHDLIFFDQRGTGRSTPLICPDFDAAMAALDATAPSPVAEMETTVEAAKGCRATLMAEGGEPAAYSATAVARDAETLRQNLGIAQWNVFATSFGTLPAAELARRSPDSIAALLLDSAFPPNSPNRAEQITATSDAFAALQARCDADLVCMARYGDLRALRAKVAARLRLGPLVNGDTVVDEDAFAGAIWAGLVDGYTARFMPEMLLRASDGEDEAIKAFVGAFGGSDQYGGYSYAQAWLMNCHSAFERPSAPGIARAVAAYPDLAGETIPAAQDAVCDALQPGAAPPAFFEPLRSDVPALIFFGEFDPATPLSDAQAAGVGLPRATLVTVEGASHAPFYTDDCTRQIGRAFFDAPGATPDLSCLAVRAPFKFPSPAEFDAFMAEIAP